MNAHKVLVVDDEEELRDILEEELKKLELQVLSVGNVHEAIQLFDQEKPLLTFCDFRMPGGNGGELLSHARSKHPSGIFCFMTGYSDFQQRELKNLRADVGFSKAFLAEVCG